MQAIPFLHRRSRWFPEYLCLFLCAGLTIFSVSCKTLRNAEPPTVEKISGFEVEGLRDGQLHFRFKTRLNNPDRLRFKIRRVEMDLMFNGVRVAQISTTRRLRIRGGLHPEPEWRVAAGLKPLISNPARLAGSLISGKVDFDIEGRITISKWGIRKTIPVKLQLPVTIPLR
jgi:hypothetical protein